MSNDETLSEKVDLNTIIMGAMIEEMNSEVHTVVELSFKDKEGHVEDFNIDSALTFEELLVATRNPEKKTKILKNIPKALRE